VHSVEDPESLYRIQILIFFSFRTFFIPDPGSYIKRGMKSKNYLFLASYGFRKKSLSKKDNSSRIRIPDPGGKKASDPGSATLCASIICTEQCCGFKSSWIRTFLVRSVRLGLDLDPVQDPDQRLLKLAYFKLFWQVKSFMKK
jgi:hypothetical protein